MILALDRSGPLYKQVYRSIREAILSGHLRSGERLPVTRALADQLGISRNVVLIAYEQLIAEGFVFGRVGAGTFVAATVPESMTENFARSSPDRTAEASPVLSGYGLRILANQQSDLAAKGYGRRRSYDFAYYLADPETFPSALWRRLMSQRLRELDLDYASAQGSEILRTEIASYLRRSRSIDCTPEQVLMVNGSQQALDLVARVLLDPGDTVVIEEPHYQGAREIFQSVGARLAPVAVDSNGLQTDRLPNGRRIRLAYVTPSHQFPTGAIMPLDRRFALLDWANRTGAYILEDDYDGHFRYHGSPLEAVQSLDRAGRVLYAGTFSRILFPSLRAGYLVMPRALIPALSKAKWIADRHTSSLQQAALADFLRERHLDRYVRRSRVRNAARRDALLRAIDRHFGRTVEVLGAEAGIHVLMRLPRFPGKRTGALIDCAARAGVRVYSAAHYYLVPPDHCELVIGYGGLEEREIATGIRILAEAVYPLLR